MYIVAIVAAFTLVIIGVQSFQLGKGGSKIVLYDILSILTDVRASSGWDGFGLVRGGGRLRGSLLD